MGREFIVIKTETKTVKIFIHEIIAIESINRCTTIYHKEELEKIHTCKAMSALLKKYRTQ